MKIEAGKRYIRANGTLSGVIASREGRFRNLGGHPEDYPFMDKANGLTYCIDGCIYSKNEPDDLDLIRPAEEPKSQELFKENTDSDLHKNNKDLAKQVLALGTELAELKKKLLQYEPVIIKTEWTLVPNNPQGLAKTYRVKQNLFGLGNEIAGQIQRDFLSNGKIKVTYHPNISEEEASKAEGQ